MSRHWNPRVVMMPTLLLLAAPEAAAPVPPMTSKLASWQLTDYRGSDQIQSTVTHIRRYIWYSYDLTMCLRIFTYLRALLAFVLWIHRWLMDSPNKGLIMRSYDVPSNDDLHTLLNEQPNGGVHVTSFQCLLIFRNRICDYNCCYLHFAQMVNLSVSA